MKIVAAILCVALTGMTERPVRAEEVKPDFGGIETGPNASETYRLNALEVVHEHISGSFPTILVGRGNWWRPVRGKFRHATTYDDFFLKLGRADLGEQDRHRRAVASTLFWGGAIVSVGGLGLLLSGLYAHRDTRAEIGAGLLGGGLVVTAVGSAIQPPLVSEEDAAEMARAYNRLLQVHLGLGTVGAAPGADRHPVGLRLSRRW